MRRTTPIGLLVILACVTLGVPGMPRRADAAPAPASVVAPPDGAPGVVVDANGLTATLAWTAVPNATSYWIYRASTTATEVVITKLATLTYRNSGLTGGLTYSYRVVAVNAGGRGPSSSTVVVTPLVVPPAVTATLGDTRITLAWQPSPGAFAYDIYRGASSTMTAMTKIVSGLPDIGFVDRGLTNGVRYYYRVQATASGAVSAVSGAVSAIPQIPPPPSAPDDLVATPGNAKIVLRWNAVAEATKYRIYRSTTGTFDSAPLTTVSTTTFTNSGLVNDTAYSYRVAGWNDGGSGPMSATATATPLAPPPSPTDLAATSADAAATLTWTPVPAAASYHVFRGTGSGKEAATAIATIAGPPFIDAALENGQSYFYKITAANLGGQSARSNEVRADPEGAAALPDPSTVSAFQLLRQSTWGPRPGDVDAVKASGAAAFIDAQLSQAPSTYPDSLFAQPVEAVQEHFMQLALTAPDQLRQRMAWALHKIWVVSAIEVPGTPAIVTYQRLLLNDAFGNYRDLMGDLTLNPAMGRYLNMLNNRSQAVTGALPNENYARELMQLFTLGIPTLDTSGVPQVGADGVPLAAYTEQDVKELARILTGWTFGDGNAATVPRRVAGENYKVPMEAVEAYHDHGAKTFLGREFAAGQTARQDLEQALDVIFAHPNVGPFISRQLIQQLVTSNPSPGYVADVAAVFNGVGGRRGDLAAVVRAILLHPEATLSTNGSGKLAEPVVFVVSQLRAVNATVTDHPFMSDKAEAMGQKVFYPPSVFSYFAPGYRVRGTTNGFGAPLGGPEFQILTAVTALERTNFTGELLGGYYGRDVAIDRAPFAALATDAARLVDYCSLLFMGGRMSPEHRAEIIGAVRVSPRTNTTERINTAIYLTVAVAQSQVDR